MSNLGSAKTFGGIGSLLTLIGLFIPTVGTAVFIIGLILVIIAIKYIADETKDQAIFNNFMYYFILNVVAIVVAMGITFYNLGSIDILNIQSQVQNMTDFASFWNVFGDLITGCILSLFIGWILLIIATIFLRKSYNSIAEKTNVNLFSTTGLIYLIGAATLIIFIGGLILLIAKIIEIVAFFSLPDTLPKAAEKPKEG
jgi:uncharacterized membrane protein